jgi:hypothetical protein
MMLRPIEIRPIKQHPYKTVPSCMHCFEDATFEALFELDSTIIAQRYYSNCIQNAQY